MRTLFQIQCHSGKDVRAHSCFQSEDEALLPAGSRFEVISNDQGSSDLRIIVLKELSKSTMPAASPNMRLEKMLAHTKPRSTINLSSWRLVDHDMKLVANRATIDKQCTELDLGSNGITSQGILLISHALSKNTAITRLFLYWI